MLPRVLCALLHSMLCCLPPRGGIEAWQDLSLEMQLGERWGLSAHSVASFMKLPPVCCKHTALSCSFVLRGWMCVETLWVKQMLVRRPWPAWIAVQSSSLELQEQAAVAPQHGQLWAKERVETLGTSRWSQCQGMQSFWLRTVPFSWLSLLCLLVSPSFKQKCWCQVCYLLNV